jgi:hypothetical protein
MDLDILRKEYEAILGAMSRNEFKCSSDKYSGVFLPKPYLEYFDAPIKVMLVGRETAGWNTDNNKNTIERILKANEEGRTSEIIDEAYARYHQHLQHDRTKSRSKFKHYYYKIAKQLNIEPEAIVHANLLAWDYDKKSPFEYAGTEFNFISDYSKQLLAAQINFFKPDIIIFAVGIRRKTWDFIQSLFSEKFSKITLINSIKDSKKVRLREFKAADALCFHIAHPAASRVHPQYRQKVLERVKTFKKIEST